MNCYQIYWILALGGTVLTRSLLQQLTYLSDTLEIKKAISSWAKQGAKMFLSRFLEYDHEPFQGKFQAAFNSVTVFGKSEINVLF